MDKKKLHQLMGEAVEKASKTLDELIKKRGLCAYWKCLSELIEEHMFRTCASGQRHGQEIEGKR